MKAYAPFIDSKKELKLLFHCKCSWPWLLTYRSEITVISQKRRSYGGAKNKAYAFIDFQIDFFLNLNCTFLQLLMTLTLPIRVSKRSMSLWTNVGLRVVYYCSILRFYRFQVWFFSVAIFFLANSHDLDLQVRGQCHFA